MPRSANLGNGSLLVTLGEHALMRDLYFPYVGMEDQTAYKHFHRIGVYDLVSQEMSWLHEKDWKPHMVYDGDSLVCLSQLKNKKLGISVMFRDGVHMQENIFIRSIDIVNHRDEERQLKLFFNQDLHLYGDKLQDTALYAPEIKNPKNDGAIIHYRKRRYFLFNGYTDKGGIDEFTVGKAHYRDLEGTWRDAEDGRLEMHAIEQGSVDSTIGFHHTIAPKGSSHQHYWMCAGKSHGEVSDLNDLVLEAGADHLLETTHEYWTNWANQKSLGCVQLDDEIMHLMKRSLLLVRTQIDRGGAIIAANDSDIMAFNKDTYTYMWPRDGALVAHALDSAGYLEVTRQFFRFCSDLITEEGFLLHKYNPDKSVGSSWHPWYRDGKPQLPIQEDETALVLYALDYHYQQFQDMEFLRPMYHSFIKPASDFLESFVNQTIGLPQMSYDLWEEHRGVHIFTVAATIAGLKSAHNIAKLMGHHERAKLYLKRAEQFTENMRKHLWNEERQCFYKFLKVNEETGEITEKVDVVDSSSMGVYLFGVLSADDDMVVKNSERIREALWVNTEVGGLARYENDWYQRTEEAEGIVGNPWIITTLWYAMWVTDRAKKPEEMKEALEMIQWSAQQATSTGVLPEQLHFRTGEHVSVSPLTWSHATFVEAVLKYCHKLEEFGICNIPAKKNKKSKKKS